MFGGFQGAYYLFFGFIILVLDIFAITAVVAGNLSVAKKIGWSVSILLLPIVGMVFYLFPDREGAVKTEIRGRYVI